MITQEKQKAVVVCPRKFSKYERTILGHTWLLDARFTRMLDSNRWFRMQTSDFLDAVESEEYPTYQDLFTPFFPDTELPISRESIYYFINYFLCSGQWLEDWNVFEKDTKIAVQLRVSRENNFFIALVRPWEEKWDIEEMKKSKGLVDLVEEKVD